MLPGGVVRLQHPAEKPCGSCCTAAAGTITRDGSSCGRNRIVTLPPGSRRCCGLQLGPHRYAAGAGVDPVIDRGQHPVAPFTINLNLRQPRLLQSVDIGVLAGFAENAASSRANETRTGSNCTMSTSTPLDELTSVPT